MLLFLYCLFRQVNAALLSRREMFISVHSQLPRAEEKSKMEGDRLAIESVLIIPAVQLSDSGNITCRGQNEAGANSSTTQLLVVGEKQRASTLLKEIDR